jgi:hypothetical protein
MAPLILMGSFFFATDSQVNSLNNSESVAILLTYVV